MAGRPPTTRAQRALQKARRTLYRYRGISKLIDVKWHDGTEAYWMKRVQHLERVVELEVLLDYGHQYGPRK